MTPAFAARRSAEPCEPTRPASLATLTIEPPPRSCIAGSTAWVTASTPRRLTPSTKSHSVLVGVDEEREAVGAGVVDEDVDRPERVAAAATAAADRGGVGDVERDRAPSISAATSRAPSRSRSAMATRAPSAASRRAVAAPMPDAPPVTSALRPSRRMTANPILAALGRPRSRSSAPPARSGFGLALRLGRAGVPVVIGSRDAGPRRGGGRSARSAAVPGGDVHGRRERRGRRGGRGRRPERPVPQPVRDADEPQGRRSARASSSSTRPSRSRPRSGGKATRVLGVWQGSAA